MNSIFTRRHLLILTTTSLSTAIAPSLGFADPDEQPQTRRKRKSKKRKPTTDESIELENLEDQFDDCSRDARSAEVNLKTIAKDDAKLQKKIDKEIALQIKLAKSIKEGKAAERSFKNELRGGKNASGGPLTDKQRDAIVRKATRVVQKNNKDEAALQNSKARVRNMRKKQNELRQKTRNMKGLSAKSKGACSRVAKKIRALKS